MSSTESAPNQLANAIRALAMDAVQQANSGHPGAPMGMAEMAQALFTRHLRHNPADPAWANRDRFVLSNGHASMLLYAALHLTGYDLPMDELRNFRQLHSRTDFCCLLRLSKLPIRDLRPDPWSFQGHASSAPNKKQL